MREAPIHQSHVYGRIKISRTFFEKGHPRNIPVKLFQNLTSSFREEDFLRISSCPYSARSPHSPEPCLWMDQNFANNFWKGSPKEHSCEIFKIGPAVSEKIFKELLKKFNFVAMATRVFDGIKFCEQFLKRTSQGTFLPSLVQIGPAVWEEKMFKEIVDDGRWTHHHPKCSSGARCAQVS